MNQFKKNINQMSEAELQNLVDHVKSGEMPSEEVYEIAFLMNGYAISLADLTEVQDGVSLTPCQATNRVMKLQNARSYLKFIRPMFTAYPVVTKQIDQLDALLLQSSAYPNLLLNVTGYME